MNTETDISIASCGNGGIAESQAPQETTSADELRKTADLQLTPKIVPRTIDTTPLPLPEKHTVSPYPIEALGERLGGAAKVIAHHVQVPIEMTAQSVLAAASLIVQSHIDVDRGKIGSGPSSLFCITVAESGDRKSAVDKLALAPIRKFEKLRIERFPKEKKVRCINDCLGVTAESIVSSICQKQRSFYL